MTSSPSGNALLLKRQLNELRKRVLTSPLTKRGALALTFPSHLILDPVDGFSAGLKEESNLYEVSWYARVRLAITLNGHSPLAHLCLSRCSGRS